GEHRRFEVVGREIVTDGEAEEVDHFIDMWPNEMRPEYPAAAFFNDRLVSVDAFGQPARGIPIRRSVCFDSNRNTLLARVTLGQSDSGDRWQRKGNARNAAVVGPVAVPVEKIC